MFRYLKSFFVTDIIALPPYSKPVPMLIRLRLFKASGHVQVHSCTRSFTSHLVVLSFVELRPDLGQRRCQRCAFGPRNPAYPTAAPGKAVQVRWCSLCSWSGRSCTALSADIVTECDATTLLYNQG